MHLVTTARFLQRKSFGGCFKYVVASPKQSINTDHKIKAINPHECQAVCRNTAGCKFFEWMPTTCRLKSSELSWTQYEWYILPNAISGPPICTRKLLHLYYLNC